MVDIIKFQICDLRLYYTKYISEKNVDNNTREQKELSENIQKIVNKYIIFQEQTPISSNHHRGSWKWTKKNNNHHVRTQIKICKDDPVTSLKAQLNKLTDSNYDIIIHKISNLSLDIKTSTTILLSRCIENFTFGILYIRIMKDIGYDNEVITHYIQQFTCPDRDKFTNIQDENYDEFCNFQKTKTQFTNLGSTIILLTKEDIINTDAIHSIHLSIFNEIGLIQEFHQPDIILSIYLNIVKLALQENLLSYDKCFHIINIIQHSENLISNKCKFIIKDIIDILPD
jgi:hypothetical protein